MVSLWKDDVEVSKLPRGDGGNSTQECGAQGTFLVPLVGSGVTARRILQRRTPEAPMNQYNSGH